jgi:hypothetical protein
VQVKVRDRLTKHILDYHPHDVVGWDGYLYPWIFNIEDFEPITGRIHQPPPVHQTFEAHNFVVCSFVPRLFDYHPDGIPAPYNHSNVNSDEIIYYAEGNFMSRKGIDRYDISMHPYGLPHGPQPGMTEASIGEGDKGTGCDGGHVLSPEPHQGSPGIREARIPVHVDGGKRRVNCNLFILVIDPITLYNQVKLVQLIKKGLTHREMGAQSHGSHRSWIARLPKRKLSGSFHLRKEVLRKNQSQRHLKSSM